LVLILYIGLGGGRGGTLERLKALRRELLDPKIAEHHGRIVKTTGDGLLVEFASVVDAVRCAAAVQQAMPERNTGVAADNLIELRIGINLGDVRQTAGDDPSVLASSAVVLAALGAEIGAMMALMDRALALNLRIACTLSLGD
jgi:class 3 adenylate cyclase